jgi:hypothetical protein
MNNFIGLYGRGGIELPTHAFSVPWSPERERRDGLRWMTDEFTSVDDLTTFERWLRYQGFDAQRWRRTVKAPPDGRDVLEQISASLD